MFQGAADGLFEILFGPRNTLCLLCSTGLGYSLTHSTFETILSSLPDVTTWHPDFNTVQA